MHYFFFCGVERLPARVNGVYIHHSTATGWWVLFATHLICLSNWSSSKDVHGFGGQNSINQNFHLKGISPWGFSVAKPCWDSPVVKQSDENLWFAYSVCWKKILPQMVGFSWWWRPWDVISKTCWRWCRFRNTDSNHLPYHIQSMILEGGIIG